MNRSVRAFAALALAAAATFGPRPVQAQASTSTPPGSQPFIVIVNSANPVESVTRDQLSKLFLKKTVRWQTGRDAMPVDLAGRTEVRISFSQFVHHKSVVSVNSYWQQQIFAGKDVPPPAMRSERDVVEFVRNTPDAVGYVSSSAELGRNIKIVSVQN